MTDAPGAAAGIAADVAAALKRVRRDIDAACRQAGREAASVTLIAVSKNVAVPVLEAAITAGQRVFGENRVQEARSKWPDLKDRREGIELHLIGPLQSNKAREAVALFDAIHSLDRSSLCEVLEKEIARQGRQPRLLVQVNTGAEPQKAGVLPEHTDEFIAQCRSRFGLPISGLMCIPPVTEAPAPHFALLAKIAARNGLSWLSMGMSADYELAIAFGATHVRVGTAIFGSRPLQSR